MSHESVTLEPGTVVQVLHTPTRRPLRPHRPAQPRKPSRIGKRNVTAYFHPEVAQQLRRLAAERDTTHQNLIGEALNLLFAKYGKPALAPVE